MSIKIKSTLNLDLVWEVTEKGHIAVSVVDAKDQDKTFGTLELDRSLILHAFPDYDEEDIADEDREEAAALVSWLRTTADQLAEQIGMND